MLAKRHLELTGLRTQAVCRLHAVLTLLRGGMGRRLSAEKASRMLGGIRNLDVIGEHRKAMARDLISPISDVSTGNSKPIDSSSGLR
jgi:hypothetical protein